jgi:hypothetical protein
LILSFFQVHQIDAAIIRGETVEAMANFVAVNSRQCLFPKENSRKLQRFQTFLAIFFSESSVMSKIDSLTLKRRISRAPFTHQNAQKSNTPQNTRQLSSDPAKTHLKTKFRSETTFQFYF